VPVIDDTAIPKKGMHSVGVASQYASALGKIANCQTLVSLTWARGDAPVMLALRLFLPESWASKRARLDRADGPAEYGMARTKPEIALVEIDRGSQAGRQRHVDILSIAAEDTSTVLAPKKRWRRPSDRAQQRRVEHKNPSHGRRARQPACILPDGWSGA